MKIPYTALIVSFIGLFHMAEFALEGAVNSWEEVFTHPPQSARPQTLWFWMNGNVTTAGIDLDLEAMKAAGLGGALIFDGATVLPEGPARYLEPEWLEMLGHAFHKADELGLQIGMHNAPGWSSSGGPWITPELAMKQLAWSESTVRGPGRIAVKLPQPQINNGYYRDAFVLAFPSLPGEQKPYEKEIRSVHAGDGQSYPEGLLSDGNLDTYLAVDPERPLLIEFCEPVELHALTVNSTNSGPFPILDVEASLDGKSYSPLCVVRDPGQHGLRTPACSSFALAKARFVRAIPRRPGVISEFVLHRTPRIEDWVFKANFAYRLGNQMKIPESGPSLQAIQPEAVIDVSEHCQPDGTLIWEAPEGSWTILRLGYTATGKLNISASRTGTGLECDKMSREAIRFHFDTVIAKVLEEAGSLAGKAFKMVEVDSYEAGMQNWTPAFPEEFTKRTGYPILGYLPALVGRYVGNAGISERFLYDFRRVQADLMRDYYYGELGRQCSAAGLDYYVEGYGQGVFDELEVSGVADYPMTEFWTRSPWSPNRTVKMVSSAAHVYGKPVVAAESFTGEENTSRWLEYPYALKALGDTMFSLGLNKMFFHRFAHQPHPTAVPGMCMGPWGIHYDRTNTWFGQSRPWIEYLARCQFLLQQGHYVADVLYFIGERPPDVAQFAMPVLPSGFNYDLVNAEVLLSRITVEDGDLVLPEGGRYRLLMLPPNLECMTPELMQKLQQMVEDGATILGQPPRHSPTLRGYPESEDAVIASANSIWNSGKTGKGRIFREMPLADVLHAIGAQPDFQFTGKNPDAALSWTHRQEAGTHIFFVANRQRRSEEVVCSFRVSGMQPEIWHPETGLVFDAAVFETVGAVTHVPLQLNPAESVFVIFRKSVDKDPPTRLTRNGELVLGSRIPEADGPLDITGDFTMSVWAKPDIPLRLFPSESVDGQVDEMSLFYAIPAGEGDRYFGDGHSMAGLAVGRNGAFVIERSSVNSPAVLAAQFPVEGWTHFAVVYSNGRPSLYVNGHLVREGLVSGRTVHPGIGSPPPLPEEVFHFKALDNLVRNSGLDSPPSNGRAFYFEGNLTQPLLFDRPFSREEIAAIVRQGLPDPVNQPSVAVWKEPDGAIQGLAWESGAYHLNNGLTATVSVNQPLRVDGPWTVHFQEGRGAPESITLPELASLHLHPDSGVRYFSGTATYANELLVPDNSLADNRCVYLDLGRVEVLARVLVNGKDAGIVWKEPFLVEVTNLLHPGRNSLEVEVSTLWTNRLIGDEQLPPESEFGYDGVNGIKEIPHWYRNGTPKPVGGRITFTTWKFYDSDDPLVASGLLGPVRLLNPALIQFEEDIGVGPPEESP